MNFPGQNKREFQLSIESELYVWMQYYRCVPGHLKENKQNFVVFNLSYLWCKLNFPYQIFVHCKIHRCNWFLRRFAYIRKLAFASFWYKLRHMRSLTRFGLCNLFDFLVMKASFHNKLVFSFLKKYQIIHFVVNGVLHLSE